MQKSEEKTHWKEYFNYDYLGAYSLNEGQELTLTIKSVTRKQVKGTGGRSEECTVAAFKEKQKPMILNKTNCKTIEKLYGTPYIEDWSNKQVTIFVQNNIEAFGDVVDALRIKPMIPIKAKPVLDPGCDKWEIAGQRVAEGMTVQELRKHFSITDENYEILCL